MMGDSKLVKPGFSSKKVISKPSDAASLQRIPTNNFAKPKTAISTVQAKQFKPNVLRRSVTLASMRAPLVKSISNGKNLTAGMKRPAPPLKVDAPDTKQTKAKIPKYDFKARYNDLLEKHTALKAKYDKLHKDFNDDNLKYIDMNDKYNALSAQYEAAEKRLTVLEKQLQNKEEQNNNLDRQNKLLSSTIENQTDKINALEKLNQTFQKSLNGSYDENKILHNTIMDLKGNIRVFCRVRPLLSQERDQDQCFWNFPDECSIEVMNHKSENSLVSTKSKKHDFICDKVFSASSSQEDVFDEVKSLVQSAIDGYNVCIFAYGQTGSGKTYTMEGSQSNEGLIPRCIDYIFSKVVELESLGWSFDIRVSFLEIYNEQLHDLLNLSTRDLDIRLVNSTNKNVYVTNLSEVLVSSTDELMQLLRKAQRNRATAQTDSNERSSRSHSVAKIIISSNNTKRNQSFIGILNLVDLAGSESPKTSTRMDETKNINKSLAQLSKVILSLQQKQDHIPYRSSKLTYLLMPSLGGSSKTLMFVNLNPLLANFNESINSLRFASQVNQVKTLKANKRKC